MEKPREKHFSTESTTTQRAVAIPNNCTNSEDIFGPVRDLADLLAELAAADIRRRLLHKQMERRK